MRLEAGVVVGERYELVQSVASGGMGDVWRARDRVLGRSVAVKMMRPDVIAEPVFAERFHEEAILMAGLSHHNIATLFDYGTYEGIAYLVMEFVEGQSLSAELREAGVLPVERVRAVVAQMALALAAAHEAGVVHRDVKPSNVLIGPDGIVKLTDFGIARATDAAGLTRTGETLGTPFYLSPERALGRSATPASDIYALGVVAHELLTGRRPFDRDTPIATALAHVTDPPPTLPAALPDDLIRIIGRCLAKEPADRPASAQEVAYALGIAFAEVPLMRPVPEQTQLAPISVSPEARLVDLMVRRKARILVLEALHAGGALGLATIGHTVWAVQTDAENVKRLAAEVPEVHFFALDPADVTLSALGQVVPFDLVLWSGGLIGDLSRVERVIALKGLSETIGPSGRVVLELPLTTARQFAEVTEDAIAAGLVLDLTLSGYDLRPPSDDATTTVLLLSRR